MPDKTHPLSLATYARIRDRHAARERTLMAGLNGPSALVGPALGRICDVLEEDRRAAVLYSMLIESWHRDTSLSDEERSRIEPAAENRFDPD